MNSQAKNRSGWVATAIFSLFMAGASIAPKILGMPAATDTLQQLGWAPGKALALGAIEALCLALHLWPRTARFGALLLTAYLGGAVATHLRVDSPLLSHTLFGVYLGILMWSGLWLRDRLSR